MEISIPLRASLWQGTGKGMEERFLKREAGRGRVCFAVVYFMLVAAVQEAFSEGMSV